MFEFCSLISGSGGNCLLVRDEKTKILIDCGLSGKRTAEFLQELNIDIKEIDALLITHEHNDHIKGAGILSRKYHIPVYANAATLKCIEGLEEKVVTNKSFSIGSFDIEAFSTMHDAADPCGYNVFKGNKKITIATDLGIVTPEVLSAFESTDFAFIEANHDINMLTCGRYPYELKRRILSDKGHLSNKACADLACTIVNSGTKNIMLSHLSAENNMPEIAYGTVASEMELLGIKPGSDVKLSVAKRTSRSDVISL